MPGFLSGLLLDTFSPAGALSVFWSGLRKFRACDVMADVMFTMLFRFVASDCLITKVAIIGCNLRLYRLYVVVVAVGPL